MGKGLDLMLESNDTLAEALTREKDALLELELTQNEKRSEPGIGPCKKKLKREVAREALARMEDAARTQNDFEAVIKIWDKLDQNEVRRVSNHEIGRGDIPLEWGMAKDGAAFPRPESAAARQAQKGDFLDIIYDCPFEMHELVEDLDISRLISQIKEDHKEILYYQAVRRYSCAKIAAIRGQTDRNIRKARATLLKKLRDEVKKCLEIREKQGWPLTAAQRDFLKNIGELPLTMVRADGNMVPVNIDYISGGVGCKTCFRKRVPLGCGIASMNVKKPGMGICMSPRRQEQSRKSMTR